MNNPEYILTLQAETDWLEAVINQVIRTYLVQEGHEMNWYDLPLPDLDDDESPYAQTVRKYQLDRFGRLALVLAMAPHFKPEVLDIFFGKNQLYDRGFTEFGGVLDKSHSGFVPTGQTLVFLIAGNTPEWRTHAMQLLNHSNELYQHAILQIPDHEANLTETSGILLLDRSWYHYFLTGRHVAPENSDSFPAQKITTRLNWDDVVLDPRTMEQVSEIQTWLEHGDTILNEWGLNRHLKPGYRSLFYGPPGTGKTLTASLLGKASGRDVFRIDLSMLVSKYIGETEKNLAKVFDIAAHKQWILFFDEADALFGKRTAANSSNDRFANQQTAYLLQRIEDFPGTIILATNLDSNMDEAFTRRFQSIIYFGMPDAEERLRLWKNAFSGHFRLDNEADLLPISEEFELAGGSIINVLRFCAITAAKSGNTTISRTQLIDGIRKEMNKSHKTLVSFP
ncbi:MAG: ATP-binding protein [Bacteroidetes bacterium]|nr:ATP-binding protein [Bacteroidota bacterium]